MTPKEAAALARRAIACPRWRWMPGMVTTYGQRIARVDADGYTVAYQRGGHLQTVEADALPNITDPATMGCLLALVREAYNDSFAHVEYELGEWIVWATPEGRRGKYSMSVRKTEADALVAALEAAP